MRAFSASSTSVNATAVNARLGYSAERLRREALGDRRQRGASPEISDATKITISSAGSARKPTIISRRAPSVPNAVPTSIAASDMNTRAVASRPTSAIASAALENGSRVPIDGMIAAAHHHRAEHDVRRDAEQRRRVLREHRILVEELADAAIRLQHARRASGSAARRGTG